MKAVRIVFRFVLFIFVLVMPEVACAVEIESMTHSGEMMWTNALETNTWYQVEWTHDLSSGKWMKSGQSFGPFQARTNTSFSTRIPLAYRVIASTNPPPSCSGMVLVDGGSFVMGDQNGGGGISERPAHEVYVSPFWIDRYEVSAEQARQVMQWAYDNGYVTVVSNIVRSVTVSPQDLLELGSDSFHILNFETGTFYVVDYPAVQDEGQRPVGNFTWYGALAYCHFRSRMEGIESGINLKSFACDFDAPGYRLPTEAEWEKAARGGLIDNYFPWPSWGGSYTSHIDKGKANYDGTWLKSRGFYNGGQAPDTGPDMANGYGLYDMAGNLAEWCWDWYDAAWYSDPASTNDDTTGPAAGTFKVIRGGYYGSSAWDLRCAARMPSVLHGSYAVGFRCVRRP